MNKNSFQCAECLKYSDKRRNFSTKHTVQWDPVRPTYCGDGVERHRGVGLCAHPAGWASSAGAVTACPLKHLTQGEDHFPSFVWFRVGLPYQITPSTSWLKTTPYLLSDFPIRWYFPPLLPKPSQGYLQVKLFLLTFRAWA